MSFQINGTKLEQTSSPAYATDLVGMANVVSTGYQNALIDTSYYTGGIKLNGDFIVDRQLIIDRLTITNQAVDNIYLGIDHLGNAGRAVNLTVLGRTSLAFPMARFGVVMRDSSIRSQGGLGYYGSGPVWDMDNSLVTGENNFTFGSSSGSILRNSSVGGFGSHVFFGDPAETVGFQLLSWTNDTMAMIDNYGGTISLSKFTAPVFYTQRRGAFALTDCRVTKNFRIGVDGMRGANAHYALLKTIATAAIGENANASTTRYIYSADGSVLHSGALDAGGASSDVVQWGKIYTRDQPQNSTILPAQANSNSPQCHRAGEYKLPLKIAHVSYSGALDVLSGVTFDISAEEYVEDYKLSPNLVNDANVSEMDKATVDAYSTIDSPGEMYDRAKAYLVDNYSGQAATIITRNGALIDAGGYNVTIDATASSAFAFDNTTITIKASTYTGDMTTTGVITLANGATFVGTRTDATGTVAPPKTVSITNITAGSRLQIYNVTTGSEIVNDVVAGTAYNATYSEGAGYSEGDTVRVRLAYVSGTSAKLPFSTLVIAGAPGWSVLAAQKDDAVYNSIGLDGSAVLEFTADFPNVQIDVADADGDTRIDRLYSWFAHTQASDADGIRLWFDGIVAEDDANFRIVTSTLNLYIDNTASTGVAFTDGRRLYRDDGASPLVHTTSGGGSITFFVGKVFTVSTAAPVITGDISAVPAAVQNGMTAQGYTTGRAAKVDNLDAAVSSRNDVAPDNASITAIKTKTDALPTDPASESAVKSAVEEAAFL